METRAVGSTRSRAGAKSSSACCSFMSTSDCGDGIAERSQRVRGLALDGAGGHAEAVSGLLDGEVLEEPKDDNGALPGCQLLQQLTLVVPLDQVDVALVRRMRCLALQSFPQSMLAAG